jgi:hypothetical protein
MTDLFQGDIDAIKTSDVEDFLGLDKDEGTRPREGPRLDYNEALPSDIGDAVASLANVDGGLIFVGVRASKQKLNVPVQLTDWDPGTDAVARISNMILATVHPRPPFEVTILKLGVNEKPVALIRVRPGLFPPYEFQQGAAVRIPVRIQDTNRQATLREIESLLEKRRVLSIPGSDLISQSVAPTDLYCTIDSPTGETRDSQFQRIVAVPREPLCLRLDLVFHREFEKLISSTFRNQFTRNLPRGWFYQVEERIRGAHNRHRIWRVLSNGGIGFVANLSRRGHPGEYIGDLILDFLNYCRLLDKFYREREYHGSIVLEHRLSCGLIVLLPRVPAPGGIGDYDLVQGIHFPESRPSNILTESKVVLEVDADTLRAPELLIAETLLSQLQETCGASIKFESLVEAVAATAKH